MRISDWSSDVCSSDLNKLGIRDDNILKGREAFFSVVRHGELVVQRAAPATNAREYRELHNHLFQDVYDWAGRFRTVDISKPGSTFARAHFIARSMEHEFKQLPDLQRSEEHTSELQSLMRISYAVFCLKNKKKK